MAERIYVESPRFLVIELEQIERSQVARRVVEKHVFRARVRGTDAAVRWTSVPFIDGGIELHSRISARPGSEGDLVPKIAGPHGFGRYGRPAFLARLFFFGTPIQMPRTILLYRFHKLIRDAHRVITGLPGNGSVGLRVPVRVIFLDFQRRDALGS